MPNNSSTNRSPRSQKPSNTCLNTFVKNNIHKRTSSFVSSQSNLLPNGPNCLPHPLAPGPTTAHNSPPRHTLPITPISTRSSTITLACLPLLLCPCFSFLAPFPCFYLYLRHDFSRYIQRLILLAFLRQNQKRHRPGVP
jgi:hypothetical protein